MSPVSLPAQITSAFFADGEIEYTTPNPRSFAFCTVVGVVGFSAAGVAAAPVRSGLIFCQRSPPSDVFITYCVPRNSAPFSLVDITSIGVHGARYFRPLMSVPQFCIGHGVMSWLNEVRRSKRTTLP